MPPVPEAPADPDQAEQAAQAKHKKLKKRRNADGDESDGGYVSDSARKRKEREKKKKAHSEEAMVEKARKEQEKEEKKRLKDELKVSERPRTKSTTSRNAPSSKDLGYETDGTASRKSKPKKPSKKMTGDGYETDDGYMSSSGKKKKGFFKRKKGDVHDEPMPRASHDPPMLPSLPIAGRFTSPLEELAPPSSLYSDPSESLLSYSSPPENHAPQGTANTISSSGGPVSFFEPEDAGNTPSTSQSSNYHSKLRSDDSPEGDSQISFPLGRPDVAYPLGRPNVAAVVGQKHIPPPLALQIPDDAYAVKSSASPRPRPFNIHTDAVGRRNPPSATTQSSLFPGSGYSSPHPTFSPGQIVTPNTLTPHSTTPNGVHPQHLSIIPSDQWILPSPMASPLPSPGGRNNFHDMPPRSPAPSSPLPDRPPAAPPAAPPQLGPSPLSHRPSAESLADQGPQRGRTSPFPTRPRISPQPSATLQSASSSLSGFEGRVKIPRYRELYALPSPVGGWGTQTQKGEKAGVRWKNDEGQPRSMEFDVEAPSDDEEDVDELRDALMGRFQKPASEEDHSPYRSESALDRSHSFNLRPMMVGTRSRSPSPNSDHGGGGGGARPPVRFADVDAYREAEYSDNIQGSYSESEEDTTRQSQWSEAQSVYSRSSFVDDEKSDGIRGKLVDNVGGMYDANGRELDPQAQLGWRRTDRQQQHNNRF